MIRCIKARIISFLLLSLLLCLTGMPRALAVITEASLAETVDINFGGNRISLAKGTLVQVLQERDNSATISLTLPDGTPLITQVAMSRLSFTTTQPPALSKTPAPATKPEIPVRPPAAIKPDATAFGEAPPKDTSSPNLPPQDHEDSNPANALNLNDDSEEAENKSKSSETLASLDTTLPPARYKMLRGFFYILVDGNAVPVVYALPTEGDHLAPSASNLVMPGIGLGEQNGLNGLITKMVENLGCSAFAVSFSFKDGSGFSFPESMEARQQMESDWFHAVLSARDELVKGFNLEKKKLIVFGVSSGGGMALRFTGTYPDEVEAVAAHGASQAPETIGKNSVKWLILNNRGEGNAVMTLPFFTRLTSLGDCALYCETPPNPGRSGMDYHLPTQQCNNLIYTFIAGILQQRTLETSGVTDIERLWPYATPKDPLKRYAVIKTANLSEDQINSGDFDLLPSSAFAAEWCKVCPPSAIVQPDGGLAKLHIAYPASDKPLATIIYFDQTTFENVTRTVEDVNFLAEHGFLVLSPSGRTKADAFIKSADNWLNNQPAYALNIHVVGFGLAGGKFISALANDFNFGVKSISLVDFDNSKLDPEMKASIEAAAKSSGKYGFFTYTLSKSDSDISSLADDLITDESQKRGCMNIFISPTITDDIISADNAKIPSDQETLVLDNDRVALDNEKMGNTTSSKDRDQIDADREQLDSDRNQFELDQIQPQRDTNQAEFEKRAAEDKALNMVMTLISKG